MVEYGNDEGAALVDETVCGAVGGVGGAATTSEVANTEYGSRGAAVGLEAAGVSATKASYPPPAFAPFDDSIGLDCTAEAVAGAAPASLAISANACSNRAVVALSRDSASARADFKRAISSFARFSWEMRAADAAARARAAISSSAQLAH